MLNNLALSLKTELLWGVHVPWLERRYCGACMYRGWNAAIVGRACTVVGTPLLWGVHVPWLERRYCGACMYRGWNAAIVGRACTVVGTPLRNLGRFEKANSLYHSCVARSFSDEASRSVEILFRVTVHLGVNITAFGREMSLFEGHPAFPLFSQNVPLFFSVSH